MKTTQKITLYCMMLGIVVTLLTACQQQRAAPNSRFVLLDGSTQTEQVLQGKVTLVNFWATNCAACVAEMPQLTSTYNTYHTQGYQTIAVAMSYDKVDYVLQFAKSRQLPFMVAIDNTGQLAQDWGPVRATPTSYLVNRQGDIVQRYVGEIHAKALHADIKHWLAQK